MSDGSSTVPSQSRHVGALDGLRGFAVLLVFCVHAAGNAATVVAGLDLGHASFLALATWPQRLLFWLQRSHHGVFLFFVLSGYLIGRMWWPQLQLSYAQFAWRRTLRIYPAFLLAFVASLLFVQSGGSTTSLAGARLAGNLLFLNGAPGSSVEPLNIVTWSLFYEMTFYLVFPLLVLAAMRASARAVQWVPVVGILAPIACVQAGADTLVLCWSLLFGGVALAFWRDAAMPLLARLPPAVVVTLYLAVTTSALLDAAPQMVSIVAFGAASVLVIAKCVAGDNAIAATLSWPPLVQLGRISYSFYLLHWMIVVLLARVVAAHAAPWGAVPSTLLIFGGGFALSVVAATVSWWVAERPYFRRARPPLRSANRT
jgi:exopolysaccharide production protein ExoZ